MGVFADPTGAVLILALSVGGFFSVVTGLLLALQHSLHSRLLQRLLGHHEDVLYQLLTDRQQPSPSQATRPDLRAVVPELVQDGAKYVRRTGAIRG